MEKTIKLACISAANIEVARNNSASVRTCEMIRDMVQSSSPSIEVEIISLIDYEMNACRMCGNCLKTQRCIRDEAFNHVLEKMIAADGIFLVVPHYAPLPSKLMMLCEKMEEIAFLGWCADQNYQFPLAKKPVGIIGHGGQPTSDEVVAYYKRMVVEPVAMALAAVSMHVIGAGAGEDDRRGVAFGIKSIAKRPNSAFVDIQHDWSDIHERISPLVSSVVAAAQNGSAA